MNLIGKKIEEIVYLRDNLRNVLPLDLPNKVCGNKLLGIERRAKYLILRFEGVGVVSHLGMTGTWRKEPLSAQARKHDHIQLHFPRFMLVYNDPRRFGFFDLLDQTEENDKYLAHLGPEPLSSDFSGEYLFNRSRKREAPVKNFIMDQKVVVGVGNIYACEALYLSGIRPTSACGKVSKKRYESLVKEIRKVLSAAIDAGGSTISDFKQAGGDSGYFQHEFKVYGKENEACVRCGSTIKNVRLGGRSSFYCSKCQK